MRNRLRILVTASLAGAWCLAAASAGAVTVAGWDFSQFAGDGARFIDVSGTPVDTLSANYSNLDPTNNAGAESAQFGTLFFDGSNGSSAATPDQFLPTAGSLLSNIDAPATGIGTNPFDSLDILQFEGQTFAQLLSMTALTPLSVVFQAGGPGAGVQLTNPVLSFAGLTLSGQGSTSVTVEFSQDGKKYSAAVGGPVTLTAADTEFEVPLATGAFTAAYARVTLAPSGPDAPVIDNVAIEATANLDKIAGKCLNGLNKGYSGVFLAAAKQAESCTKAQSKGTLVDPTVLACLGADPKGKVAKAKAKNTDPAKGVGVKSCTCSDPKKCAIPFFGYSGDIAASTNVSGTGASNLQTLLFGNAPDLGILSSSAAKDGSACQLAVQKEMNKFATTSFKEFVSCKKQVTNPKGGATVPVGVNNPATGPADLEACLGFDPKGKIAKASGKVLSTVTSRCVDKGVVLADAFGAGQCGSEATAAGFAACVEGLATDAVADLVRSVDNL